MSILWDEARGIPAALEATIERAAGFDAVVERLADPAVSRIVATGNGAAYYVAMGLWLASLRTPGPVPVIAVPSGIAADPSFDWGDGDLLLAVSSSGAFRDVVRAAANARRSVAVTADPESALARQVDVSAVVQVQARQAVTHTQAYCGAAMTALAIWSRYTADVALDRALRDLPGIMVRLIEGAESWAEAEASSLRDLRAAVAFGSGPGWAAALEAALLLKEVAGIPAEGVETREGATSAMYALGLGHLVLSIGPAADPALREAEEICASTGATVVRVPDGEFVDPRLTPLLSFPATLALAINLGTKAGIDVDDPSWARAYERTARTAITTDGPAS